MRIDPLFKELLTKVDPAVKAEVHLNMDIINRIYDILNEKHMTQRELAAKMGKRESEISRWLSGERGFTTSTIAKISAALGEPIVEVRRKPETRFVFIPVGGFATPSESIDGNYTDSKDYSRIALYNN